MFCIQMKKLLLLIGLLLYAITSYSLSVSSLYSSNMVLQQESEITIWGWGKPGQKVEVNPSWNSSVITIIGENKNWKVTIITGEGGYNQEIISITSGEEVIFLENILIGEVWLAVGQTNITDTFSEHINPPNEVYDRHTYPDIRFMTVKQKNKGFTHEDISGEWLECNQKILKNLSELGYYFAFNLNEKLNIPIGVVIQDWGDAPIDSWQEESVLDKELNFLDHVDEGIEKQPFASHHKSISHHALMYQYRNYKFKGILWSHGKEQPNKKKGDYKNQMMTLIANLRKQFGQIPFYYVQIAPFKYRKMTHGALIRDQQRQLLHIKNTAMVVTSDISDIYDLYTENKDVIGIRLSKLALKRDYKVIDKEVVESPRLEMIIKEGKKILVYFKNNNGLHFENGDQGDFEVSGDDGEFQTVSAKVEKGVVVLELHKIKKPQFVRFGWNSRAVPLLVNESGLPASCFSKQKVFDKKNKNKKTL